MKSSDVESSEGISDLNLNNDETQARNLKGGGHSPPNVRYMSWGIFTVAYELESAPLTSILLTGSFLEYRFPLQSFIRYMKDLWRLSRWYCAEFYICMIWQAFAPSLSLCLASLVIFNIDALFKDENEPERTKYIINLQLQISGWLFCGLISYRVENSIIDLRAHLGGHIRAHFIPKLVEACLEWDLDNLDESYGEFPYPHDYGDTIPGWEYFENVFNRLSSIFVVIFEVLSMAVIITQFHQSFDAYVLSGLVALFLMITFLTPNNGAGGGGYTFWTINEDYNRLMVLFNIVFDHQYRLTILKDGLVDFFTDEYKRVSTSLGVVKADTWILSWNLLPPWHWGLSRFWMINYPMALCAIFVTWAPSRTILMTMIIFQYSIFTMHQSIETLRSSGRNGSFLNAMNNLHKFYRILDKPPTTHAVLDYPNNTTFRGTNIELKNVSYKYPQSDDPALQEINLSIKAGQLVVLAGVNGSGKTTLAKLISGLAAPTSGQIYADNNNLQKYDPNKFRQAVAFVAQSEAIYPVSLRENLLLGLTTQRSRLSVSDLDLDEAASLGGSLDLIKQHGYNRILNPCSLVCYSIRDRPGQGALDALTRSRPSPRGLPISTGEQQRIIASRAFMRLKHGNIKLIILDEPTNALDNISESKIFEHFRNMAHENGQTMIIVTHRLANVAKHADLILCMHQGRIEERGVHEDLIAAHGRYASLYNAQAFVDS